MKTRLLFLSLSIFIASTTISHAQVVTQGNNILGSIKYSDKTINKKIYTNTVVSITSYCYINDNTVALLDADEQKIVIYSLNDKSVSKTIYLPYSAIDFDYYSNKFYILDYDKVYIVNNNGIKESEINYRKPLGIPFAIEKFKVINGRNILNISDGTTWEIASDGITKIDDFYWHYENGYKGRTEKINLRSFELSALSDDGISSQNLIDISSLGLSDYLATTRIVSINNNEIALDIETSNNIDNPRRFLILTDINGNLISKTEIPFVYETSIKSPFCKYKNSISYCLTTPNGLNFYEINSQKNQIILPIGCPKKIHYNNNLPKNDFEKAGNLNRVNKVTSVGTNSVTRTQVYENALKFRDLEWKASSSNKLTSCTQITTGTYAKSPSWIEIGSNSSVPYKWGGYTDWSEFADLASQGKYTGNIFCTTQDANGNVTYTNGVCSNISNTGSSIIGVDCSGFVSRCWETGHYTTKSLPKISTNLGNADISSNFNKLQVGDIVNDYGSHVRLCLSNNPSGTATFMEASARDWKVSAYSYTFSELTGYICYKYNNINDARLRLAQDISISPSSVVQGNSLTATYKIGNYGSESWTGYVRLYIIQSDGDEITLQTQGPITLSANAISNTYSFTSSSVSSPAGATKLEVRVQNSNGSDYGRYYKAGAISPAKNPLEFNISGCTAPSQPSPISGNTSVCEGSNQTYSISAVPGATSYTWLIPNGWTYTENGTSVSCKIPTGSAGGTIKVAAVNSCGSSTQRTLSVTTNALPASTTVNGGGTFCNSATLTASGGSGGTIYWQGTTSNGTSTATASSSQTVTTSGTYYFRSYNSCGWGTQGSASVTINSVPATTTVNGGGTFCNSAVLTASGGSGGTIYWQGTTSNGSSTATASSSQTVTSSGTYYFRSYNSCGWGTQGSATVMINSAPSQPGTITGNTAVTSGNTYQYSISSVTGVSYTWSYNGVTQSGTGATISLTPTSSGKLSVIANNNCGSSSPTTLDIVVNALSVSSNTLSLNSAINSNGTITITSNTSWTVSSNQAWLTVSTTSGSNNGTLILTANSANTTTSARTATVTVTGTGVTTQTITVTQQGTSQSLSLSANTLSLNSAINSNGTISITSNTSWTASSNQTWLTVSSTSGSNNGTLILTATSANTSSTARTATVTVTGTGVSAQTITITQQGTSPSLSLSANTLSLNPAINSNGTITITSNTAWTASSNQTWLTVNPTSGSNNGTLILTANSANTTTTSRTATVTVSGTGVTAQIITVTQSGTGASLSLSGNTMSLNSAINSNGTISITSNTSWTASSNQTWLTVSPTSGSNNGTLTLTANSANTTTTGRSTTVTITGTGVTAQTITVTQQGTSPSLSLSANALSLNSAINSNGTISITSNTSWTTSSNQTWLTVSPTSGSNNGTLTLTANSANATTTARTATVTVSGTGVSTQTITVTQSGTGVVNYTISTSANPSAGGITSGGGTFVSGSSKTVTAIANTGYTFTNWTENGTVVSTLASYTFTITANRTLVANFNNGQVDLTTDLVAYYPFNGNANDESGNGNNGTYGGGAILTTDKSEISNKACNFGGYDNSSFLKISNTTSLQFSNELTISLFAKINTTTGMDGWGIKVSEGNHCLFAKNADWSGFYALVFPRSVDSTGIGFNIKGTNADVGVNVKPFNLMAWNHYAFTVSSSEAVIYLNGTKIKSKSISPPNFTTANANDLYFGRFISTWYPFNGKMDEIRIYKRTLSATEINRLYTDFIYPTGLNDVNAQLLELNLYPNPANTFLQISSPEILQRIEVCDIAGRLIFTKTINSDKCTLETNDFVGGIYIVKGFTDQGIITGRFVKK